jgi:hypothetical protein
MEELNIPPLRFDDGHQIQPPVLNIRRVRFYPPEEDNWSDQEY